MPIGRILLCTKMPYPKTPKMKWPLIASFAIFVFLYKLRSSTIKGYFCTFFVSNIIFCTSLSFDRFDSVSESHLRKPGDFTGTLDSPFLFSGFIITPKSPLCKSEFYTVFLYQLLCCMENLSYTHWRQFRSVLYLKCWALYGLNFFYSTHPTFPKTAKPPVRRHSFTSPKIE